MLENLSAGEQIFLIIMLIIAGYAGYSTHEQKARDKARHDKDMNDYYDRRK